MGLVQFIANDSDPIFEQGLVVRIRNMRLRVDVVRIRNLFQEHRTGEIKLIRKLEGKT